MSDFWQDGSDDQILTQQCPVVDIAFGIIDCNTLPVDHAQMLAEALAGQIPWFAGSSTGLHLIQAAASGNGWISPQDAKQDLIVLSKRTKLVLRVPRTRIEAAASLVGQTLELAGHPLTIGPHRVRELLPTTTLYARYVMASQQIDDKEFLSDCMAQLSALGVGCKKLISGLPHCFVIDGEARHTRSLMLADLTAPDSMRLQEHGIGEGRNLGFGLFIPHKDIKKVESR